MSNDTQSTEPNAEPESNGPNEELTCKICWGGDETEKLVKSCKCEGTSAFVHASCLQDWLRVNPNAAACIICKSKYKLPFVTRARRLCRRYVGISLDLALGTVGLLYILALFARPLGFLLWFVFSVSTTDPFDSPMFLFMMKSRETWNDVELDIDSALSSQHHIPFAVVDNQHAPLIDALVARLAIQKSISCEEWLDVAKYQAKDPPEWILSQTSLFLNKTCGRHPDLGHLPALRYCQCNVDQRQMAGQLQRSLLRSLYRVNCSHPLLMHRTRDGNDVYYHRATRRRLGALDEYKVDGVAALLRKFVAALDYVLFVRMNPVRPLVARLLPYAVGKYRAALTYVKYTPRLVNWQNELRNPRFYGFPLGVQDGGLSRGFIIKSLDFHFCITLICGIVIDLFLFIRLWYTGMNPIVEALQQGLTSQNGADGGMGANSGYHSMGFGGGWLMHVLQGIKSALVEQWKTWVLLIVFQFQMLKAWWAVSQWSEIIADVLHVLLAFLCCLVIYVYLMILVSLIVLRTFELDVLHFYGSGYRGFKGY